MDITKLYRACVKAAKVKGKSLSADRILPKSKEKKGDESFDRRAAEVIRNITKLRDYLFSCQTEYLGEFSPLVSISSKMTEEERQQIESDAQAVLTSCSNAINSLKNEVGSLRLDDQAKAHSLGVLDILDAYLKDVCKLYSQQRAFRVKQALEQKRMSRLRPENGMIKERKGSQIKNRREENRKTSSTSLMDAAREQKDDVKTIFPPDNERKPVEIKLTHTETQALEQENKNLYDELNNIEKEVKNIEGKVVEISKLQDIFQEKILSQADQIETINETTVSTAENVKEGNEQIREAIKNSASFRVWILFFLVMCTFSLLFLDWYND